MKHRITIAVEWHGKAGSASLTMEGAPDMLDDAEPADVAEALAEALVDLVQRAIDGELDAELMLDDDDEEDEYGPN